jgi:hypothetical protein
MTSQNASWLLSPGMLSAGFRTWHARTLTGIALVLLAVLLQLAIFDRGVVPMDEGQLVAIAARILDGEVLYRDVHTGLFPGIYYLSAFLFTAAGTDVIVTRWAALVINSVTVVLLYLLALRTTPLRWAVLAPLLYVALIPIAFPGLTMLNYSPLALMFGFAALLFLIRYMEDAGLANAAAVGVFAAAATLTKQNFGGLVVLALLATVALCRGGSARARSSLTSGFLAATATASALAAVVVLQLAANGALPYFLESAILALFHHQASSFNNPIPPLLGPHPVTDGRFNFLYLPPALVSYLLQGEHPLGLTLSSIARTLVIKLSYGLALGALIAGPVVIWLTRKPAAPNERRAATAIGAFAFFLFFGLFPSAIWLHLAYVAPPLILLTAVVAARIGSLLSSGQHPASRAWQGACFLLVAGGLMISMLIVRDIRRWNSEPLLMQRGSLFVQPDVASRLRSAGAFVTSLTAPGDPIFVAPTMPILYFLTGRHNPTPYEITVASDHRESVVIENLDRSRPVCAVYDPHMYIEFPPFNVLFPELDQYLRHNYRAVKALQGGHSVWLGLMRRGEHEGS